jgi:predicted nucleic acid-binding protein
VKAYLDSSAIVKLYAPEAETAAVAEYVRSLKEALPFSRLHAIEVKNALRLKVYRKESPARPVSLAIRLIEKDVSARVLERPELDWPEVFRKADELSKRFASRWGSRSLDLLHVASCMLIGCRDFLSYDERQVVVAKKAGLHVVRPGKN